MFYLRQLARRRITEDPPYQMNFEQRIRVVAILGKYLRTHAVTIAAIGAEKKQVNRQVLVERLSAAVMTDKDVWTDILYVFSSVLGSEKLKENIDLKTIVETFYRGWKYNRLDESVVFCAQIGILSKSDTANMMWVVANWRTGSVNK